MKAGAMGLMPLPLATRSFWEDPEPLLDPPGLWALPVEVLSVGLSSASQTEESAGKGRVIPQSLLGLLSAGSHWGLKNSNQHFRTS